MSRGVRIRIMAFVALSAVGITYVTATYLGLVDRVLGRGITATVELPGSGGLFEGSEVTYRGVKIGKVTAMDPTDEGIDITMELQPGTELPLDSAIYVHNLSAVGEQYLDFQPRADSGPYAEDGSVFTGTADALPVDEGDLLVDLDNFVSSVDKQHLQTTVKELGLMFGDTGDELQTLLDSGSEFVDEAAEHTDETVALLQYGLKVLRTQSGQSENIRSFARDLNTLTSALRRSDKNLRTTLSATPGAAREVEDLLKDLEPTLPAFLADLSNVNQVVLANLAGLEQLLVTFPVLIANGFSTPRDGWGHVNLQFDYSQPPCTEGYMPPEDWRLPSDLTDGEIYPAKCESKHLMRGTDMAPRNRANAAPERSYTGGYDPVTGAVEGYVDANGNPVRVQNPGNLSVLGGDAWKWLLVGPVAGQ
jgi:phospholipid/cholesterol/gamma-HCH transport system substrate-binding protein